MARKFTGGKLVIASHNAGKVREIHDLLAPFGANAISAGDLHLAEPVEDGDSFTANARIKALAAAKAANLPALADDSGLCVHALNNEPGVFSARWAGEGKDFTVAMRRIEDALNLKNAPDYAQDYAQDGRPQEDRGAHFVCALCLAWPDGHTECFEGQVFGAMTWPPRGDKGFGYDPTFIPDGHDVTFAEMAPEQKHRMSHRAAAFNLLVAACFKGD